MRAQAPLAEFGNPKAKLKHGLICSCLGLFFIVVAIYVTSSDEKRPDRLFLVIAISIGLLFVLCGVDMLRRRNLSNVIIFEGEIHLKGLPASPKNVRIRYCDIVYYAYDILEEELILKTREGKWYRLPDWCCRVEGDFSPIIEILESKGVPKKVSL